MAVLNQAYNCIAQRDIFSSPTIRSRIKTTSTSDVLEIASFQETSWFREKKSCNHPTCWTCLRRLCRDQPISGISTSTISSSPTGRCSSSQHVLPRFRENGRCTHAYRELTVDENDSGARCEDLNLRESNETLKDLKNGLFTKQELVSFLLSATAGSTRLEERRARGDGESRNHDEEQFSLRIPVVVVNKKDGPNLICIDYRLLNKLIVFNSHP
ncbi:hypothetical protein PoB_003419700 [Plakobranchus ocellatus]|uniref:Uncharacterized protein n=1 Tax=Plakobranchus ocellatus TaxID=259542 RepID=A0AAV4ALB2_9GAST|nr:hypothetical protein PoB_003419700 [Plakobranchus ocellatus]